MSILNKLRPAIRRALKNQGPKLPRVQLHDLAFHYGDLKILDPDFADGNVSFYELAIISLFVSSRAPKTVFEIGTFDGRTALNMAANSPADAAIYTLDLPGSGLPETSFALEEIEKKYVDKPLSGARFSKRPEAGKITQLHGDSAKFDFSPYYNQVDFVFVDASHAYDYVLNDSAIALKLLRGGRGAILWHDYGSPFWPGVTRALDELHAQAREFAGLKHIDGSSIVCLTMP